MFCYRVRCGDVCIRVVVRSSAHSDGAPTPCGFIDSQVRSLSSPSALPVSSAASAGYQCPLPVLSHALTCSPCALPVLSLCYYRLSRAFHVFLRANHTVSRAISVLFLRTQNLHQASPLSLIHISAPQRTHKSSYAAFCSTTTMHTPNYTQPNTLLHP